MDKKADFGERQFLDWTDRFREGKWMEMAGWIYTSLHVRKYKTMVFYADAATLAATSKSSI